MRPYQVAVFATIVLFPTIGLGENLPSGVTGGSGPAIEETETKGAESESTHAPESSEELDAGQVAKQPDEGATATPSEEPRVLLYDLGAPDASSRQRAILFGALKAEIAKRTNLRVVTRGEPSTTYESPTDCPDERPSCLTQLGKQMGADIVVFGQTASLGETRVLTLKRLRLSDAEMTHAVVRQATGASGEEYLVVVGDAVEELFADHPIRENAVAGVPEEVVSRWNPSPLRPWVVWAGAGATAIGVGVTVATYLSMQSAVDDHNKLAAASGRVDGSRLVELNDQADSWARAANVALGVTVGLAACTAILALFTDWGDDGVLRTYIMPAGSDSVSAAAVVRF